MLDYVPIISNIKFTPMKEKGSFIGFVSFIYDGDWLLQSVSVHKKADRTGYRLDYPKDDRFKDREGNARKLCHPIRKEVQQLIEQEITSYLKVNWIGKTVSLCCKASVREEESGTICNECDQRCKTHTFKLDNTWTA